MVALALTDVTDITPPAVRPVRAVTTPQHRPSGDPLIDATTRLLSVPLRQAYALLWRAGLLVVDR